MKILNNIDKNILIFIQKHLRTPFLTNIMQFISSLFNFGFLSILTCIILLCNKKTKKIGIIATYSLILSSLITNILLKPTIKRIRPYDLINEIIPLTKKLLDFSFPSGHTSAAFAVSSILFFNCSKKIGIPAMILATLVGFSRLYLGVHYPTDVLFGIIIGFSSGIISNMLLKK